MARKLEPCPLCGAKMRYGWSHYRGPGTPLICSKHVRACARPPARGINGFVESGCPYEVPDLRAHLAICAKLAEKPKREVLARGWGNSGSIAAGMVWKRKECSNMVRVLIVRAGR